MTVVVMGWKKWEVVSPHTCDLPSGATRTNEAKELLFARQYVVTVAKAFKLQAIDLVYIDYKGKNHSVYCLVCHL